MAMDKGPRRRDPAIENAIGGFDVTVETVIGHVELGEGDEHPHAVAFRFIAEHGAEGTYRFPLDSGLAAEVTVRHYLPTPTPPAAN